MSTSPLAATTGVVTGINWNNIISEMLSAESQPLVALEGQQSETQQKQQVFTSLQSSLAGLQSAAESLRTIGGRALDTSVANSTDSSVATATAQTGALSANLSLQILSLATAATAVTSGNVFTGAGNTATAPSAVSPSDIRSSDAFDPTASLSSQAADLGLPPGSAGTITVNGTSIAWTGADSLNDILGKINSSSSGATATFDAGTGKVSLVGTDKGSASTLALGESSGTLLEALGLSAGTSSGTDASAFDPTATLASQSAFLDTPLTAGTLTLNGVKFEIDPSTQSLDDILQAVNASGAGVQGVFDVADGQLDFSSTAQGAAAPLALGDPGDTSNFLSTFKLGAVTAGQDAQVSVNGGATQSLSGNSSTTLLPGANVTFTGLGSTTLSVGASASDAAQAVQSFVNAFNSALGSVNGFLDQAPPTPVTTDPTAAPATQSPNANPSIQGAFMGNALLQQTADTLVNQVVNTQLTGGSITQLSQIGITLTLNDGGDQPPTLTFNQSAFESAYATNPNAVNALVADPTTGLADNLYNSLQGLVDPVSGAYTLQINGENNDLKDLGTQISDMQANLNFQQKSLQSEYAQLEATLGTMQQQGQQISGTLATLASATVSTS